MGILTRINDVLKDKASWSQKRSSQWPKIRKRHLSLYPVCEVCGGTSKLEVHHIVPFHEDPSLELNENNLMTLCESASYGVVCHLFIGHFGNYKLSNPYARLDAALCRERLSKC